MGSLEFIVAIRPASWSKEGLDGGECAALVVEAGKLWFESRTLLHLGRYSSRVPVGSEPDSAACSWERERHLPCKFLGKTGIGHVASVCLTLSRHSS